MNDQATLLLVDNDAATLETFRSTVGLERQVKIAVARNGQDAMRVAKEVQPDLIVLSGEIPGTNVFGLCQSIRQDPALESTMLVLIIPAGANDMRFAGLTFGVDEYLERPVEPAEVVTKLHSMLRLRRVNEQMRTDKARLEEMHEHLRASFDQLLQLMSHLLDMSLPGAADRGRRIAELALKVSARFGIPQTHLRDLEITARLHELGRVVMHEGTGPRPDTDRGGEDWRYILSTRAIFARVEGLSGAAELAGVVYENWDGTGRPEHLQQGQIPLRGRILRVLIDLFARIAREPGETMDSALDHLQNRVGTHYDPMVLVHLRAVVSGAAEGDVQGRYLYVPIAELKVDMVLAEDLCTDSGIKLLSRGTRITPASLEVIHRRHSLEPIVQGAAVLRAAA